jgi:hypothetical protein
MSGLTIKNLHICCCTRLSSGDLVARGALSNCASIEVHRFQFFGVAFVPASSRDEYARVPVQFLLLFV